MAIQWIAGDAFTCLSTDPKPTLVPPNTKAVETDTDDVYKFNGTAYVLFSSAGGGGGGGGFAAGGSITKNGGSTLVQIAHGLTSTPDVYYALPLNEAARGIISYSADTTNININYPIAPASGTNNLSYVWGAGYIGEAVEGFTPTSITTLTGKTIDFNTNTILNDPQIYDFLIYPLGSLDYRVRSGATSQTVYESNNASLQDAVGAMSYARDNLPSITRGSIVRFNPGVYTLQSGFSLTHNSTRLSTWTGPSPGIGQSAQIKPNGAYGCLVVVGDAGTGLTGITIKNLCFTHSKGAANATTPFIRFQNMARETLVQDCYFMDTSETGNAYAIQYQLTNSTTLQYLCKVRNCQGRGINALIHINNTVGTPNGTGWMSSFDFDYITAWNSKYLVLCNTVAGSKNMAFNFSHFHYQWSLASEPPVGGAAIELNSSGNHWWWRFNQGMIWDLPSDRNHANFNATSIIAVKNCHLYRLGGSASAVVQMDDITNHRRGVFTGNGGAASYTIPHGLGLIPTSVHVTPQSANASALHYVSSKDATNFVVTYPGGATPAGASTVVLAWEAFYR